jgi:hypothetical protein
MSNFKWGLISAICALIISILLGIVSEVGAIHIFVRALIFSAVFFGVGFSLRFVLDSFFPELLTMDDEEESLSESDSDGHISIAMDSMGEYAVPELFNKQGNSQEIGHIDDLVSGVYRRRSAEDDFAANEDRREYPNLDFSMPGGRGIDRNNEAGYNSGVIEDIPFGENEAEKPAMHSASSAFEKPAGDKRSTEKPAAIQPQFTPSLGDDSGLGGLPDLDMMAMAFSSNYSDTPVSAASSHSAFSAPSAHPVEEFEPDRSQYKGNKPQTLQGDFDPKSLAEGIRTVLSKE